MKQGRKLKLRMKELLVQRNLDPSDWLVVKDLPGGRKGTGELQVVHKKDRQRVLMITY